MRRIAGIILLAGALVWAGWLTTLPASAQTFRTIIDGWVFMDKLNVTTDVTIGGSATVADTLTTDTGIITSARLAAGTAVSITQNATLTPLASYQPIESAGTVSFGAITAGTAGDVLVLVNQANTTITISDTGTLKLSGNLALGQYDSLTLISDGTNWVQLATTNN